jgi:outer membrane protein assembly factor BamA
MPAMLTRFSPRNALASLLVALSLLLFSGPIHAGQEPQFHLAAVNFPGLSRYSKTQATMESGLRVGDTIRVAQLQDAANRLSQSGAFDKLSFRYVTRGNELTAEFQVTETTNIVSCVFDNFIWFSAAELDKTLRDRVPFYDGTIPGKGATLDETASALQALLRAKGIDGTVEQIPYYEKAGGPITGFSFHVNGVSMPVRHIHFPGTAVVAEAELVSSSQAIGKDYSAMDMKVIGSGTLLPIYHRQGYLKAHFDPPQAVVDGSDHTEAGLQVSVTMPVAERLQYSLARAAWNGNHQLSTDDLNGLLGMKPQEVANQDKFDAGLRAVKIAYAKRGCIDATMLPTVTLNDDTRLASYDIAIDEGIQYHMGQLHISGVPDRQIGDLTKKWQVKPGALYDATYPSDFLQKIAVPELTAAGVLTRHSEISTQRDQQGGTVDVSITFR